MSTKTVRLLGSAQVVSFARLRLEKILQEINCNVCFPLSGYSGSSTRAFHLKRNPTASLRSRYSSKDRTFVIRAKEDSSTVVTWIEHILPLLPSILNKRILNDYTANLVRSGSSKDSARPVIQIQSSHDLSDGVRAEIRKGLLEICCSKGREYIPVLFSKGSMALLVESSAQIEASADEDQDDDDEYDFPLFKRWWGKPGMGASIGMRCSRSVSATLGGHIMINNEPYMLTVQHFIDKAKKHLDNPIEIQEEPFMLTSPSLFDVDFMRVCIEQTKVNMNANLRMEWSNQFGDGEEIPIEEVQANPNSHVSLQMLAKEEQELLTLQEELYRDEQDFELGPVYTYEPKPRVSTTSPRLWRADRVNTHVLHRMDWALCRVHPSRKGVNRHRYRGEHDPVTNEDYWSDGAGLGDGDFCQHTCDPKPNMRVYYVGRKSGLQSGEIEAAPMLVLRDGFEYHEWSLKDDRGSLHERAVEGDSGAFLISELSNKIVGLLYGLNQGRLIFTPIREVFADIESKFPHSRVTLPQPRVDPSEMMQNIAASTNPGVFLICDVAKEKPKVKAFNLHRKPRVKIVKPKQILTGYQEPISSEPDHIANVRPASHENDPVIPSLQAQEALTSSPPSLTSSAASTPFTENASFADYSESRDDQLFQTAPGSPSSLADSPFIVRVDGENEEDDRYVVANEQQQSRDFPMSTGFKEDFEDSTIQDRKKHSLEYILNNTSKDWHAGHEIVWPDLPQRKSHTFPLFGKEAGFSPLTSTVCAC